MEFLFLSFNTSSDLYKYDTATPQTSTNSLSHPPTKNTHRHTHTHTYTPHINLNSSNDLNQNYISTLSPDCQNFHPVFGLGENLYSHTHTHICTPPKKSCQTPLPTLKILHTQLFGLGQTIHTTAPSRLDNNFHPSFLDLDNIIAPQILKPPHTDSKNFHPSFLDLHKKIYTPNF
jgi:hypothetical protein